MIKKFIEEFKAFAFKGNVIDMAVGVMIGSAIGKVNVSGWFIALDGNSYPSAAAAEEAGAAVFKYGSFLSTVIDFFLIALCIFVFVKIHSVFFTERIFHCISYKKQ